MQKLPQSEIVLLGVGHTNAHLVRMWRMNPLEKVRLTCVSNFPMASYSGMLPGVLAHQYPVERMQIDLVRLCASSGVRLILNEVTGLDVEGRQLLFADRSPLPFDVLSIGIGSVPNRQNVQVEGDLLLPIKPMQTFLQRLESHLSDAKARTDRLQILVVGGGAGGLEICCCLPARLQAMFSGKCWDITLIHGSEELTDGLLPKTRDIIKKRLESQGVQLLLGKHVEKVGENSATLDTGETLPADCVLWATDAAAPPLLKAFDLPKDARGFLLTGADLKTVADAPIFAVGDTGTIQEYELPKAGVYAVRSAPVLWENVQHLLANERLEKYVPQKQFMKLLNLGDGTAVGDYRGFSFRGRWVWKLKDWIDGRFMDKYQEYPLPKPMHELSEPEMRCVGCGGKIGGSVLSRVLSQLDIPQHPNVLLGLDQPDDISVIQSPQNRPVAISADFFVSPVDDPDLAGRLAALNALSDLSASNAQPFAALALVTLPRGQERQQEQLLRQALEGSLREFRRVNVSLIGGHTIEGSEFQIGFTVLGEVGESPVTKAGLQPGDHLILTKPLGSGILLAGQMRALCRGEWWNPLVECMLTSNQLATQLFQKFPIRAATDITGFGLAGHLLEMLRASNLCAEISVENIPLLPGVVELLDQNIESTMVPANRTVESEIDCDSETALEPGFAALFDPQTCGGLLLGVPAEVSEELLADLKQITSQPVQIIGKVLSEKSFGQHSSVRLRISRSRISSTANLLQNAHSDALEES